MQTLVEGLLTLARADDAGLAIKHVEVDLDDLVDAEVKRLRATVDAPVVAHLEPISVTGDPGRLAQVLRNVADNAVRHTTGAILVTMDGSEPQTARVHIDNAGAPVPVDRRELIFERFTRLDESRVRDEGGSGLGLAIARTIARAHGGDVTATESPDGQCRFTFVMPRTADHAEPEVGALRTAAPAHDQEQVEVRG